MVEHPYSEGRGEVYIYAGRGAGKESIRRTEELVKDVLGPEGFPVFRISCQELLDGGWTNNCRLLIIPGGADSPWVQDLNGKGCRLIRTFVEDGGSFLGTCAGSYFGSSACVFDKGGPLEVLGPRELAFHTGPAVGPHLAAYKYDSNSGARAAELVDEGSDDSEFPRGPIFAYFNGGPSFPSSQFPRDCRSEVLYRYASSGEPAILRCPVGSGKAILSGVHFEVLPEELAELDDENLTKYGVCESMFRTEKKLKILARQLLLDLVHNPTK
ncbi:Biotin--protein ligase, putative [Perkinsus marinus ATCC 50983]|uniref:Biotin--protein ligase, putative n=1 Tax=Perkinsus marinus (strain ATCC 50983 / TXsc) TaxID=423536 RepID=C5LGH7_PERM5|nr:Biotin--protein ligase, putative [Perkinsus marinus ATCC 50983]EER04163.1 Biotin--protein ligase, putative [Perkinsus marinus ATCC 50983]|eukprot:XP_002772347.1 Biotin--protein ligase, putative [Perkinsus marinus ATCC 50983]